MEHEDVRDYWNERAKEHKESPEATTNDYYMREIEIRSIKNKIDLYIDRVKDVADIGCGNGFSTIELARQFKNVNFVGYDYSEEMIKNAKQKAIDEGLKNISFNVLDVVNDDIDNSYDLIYTDRCLINLTSWNDQKIALEKIVSSLTRNGIYVMIENFIDGQNNLNNIRKSFGLNDIAIRDHNLFFDLPNIENFVENIGFNLSSYENISSAYYLVSRVIYSKTCMMEGSQPDYYNIHHELGSKLPSCGNFGPIALCVIEKEEK
jgi:ubiquinone/menaquinone biosynthesis C-methylase UbiE